MEIDVAAEVPEGATLVVAVADPPGMLPAAPVYAAEFLREFAGDGPWAHIDIAGPAFLTWPYGDYLWQRGGTGYGVRLLAELASRLASR